MNQLPGSEIQAAILNAIPAHIALLDSEGVILAVNEAWKRFAAANVLQGPGFGVGFNYLEVCERATGDCAEEANEVGRGLRRILSGEISEFSLEYPGHSPAKPQWFRLMASPLGLARPAGAVVMHINITERKQAEEALRAGEARLVAAQAVAKVGSWETDLTIQTVLWSAETHRIFETDPAVFAPTHAAFLEKVHPEDRAIVDETFQQSLASHKTQAVEHRLLMSDGRVKFIEERWQVVRDKADRPICATGTCQDITVRKQAEAALQASEAEFRLLAEAMPQIVWITRADGWNIYFNRRWLDYTGLTLEESLGNGWHKPFHPDDQLRAWDSWQHATATGGTYSLECRLRRADGVYQWWLVRGVPRLGPTGEILKWFGTCTDIDESKRTQVRIAEQAALLDNAHDAIIVRDADHHITYWNKAAERIYGWTAAEACGRRLQELLHIDALQFAQAQRSTDATGSWNGEIQKTAKNGTVLTVEGGWTLVRDSQGVPRSILTIDTDITARKKLEQQFLRAQRMESIGTLAGGIAHDLNNLLAPITMGVDLLKLFEPNPRSLPVIENIERSAKRGADLVKQVLSFARGVEGARVALQVRHILKEIDSIATNTFPKSITVETSLPQGLWPVQADPTQLNQVVLNLCVNARDAMPNGGRLDLAASNAEIDPQYAAMNRGMAPGRYVVIQVTDTGIGMPQEIIDRIFEPFFTTKELGKGTGLGLSTVLGIVRSHGGFVNVYSEVGRGSTFKVYLPALEEGEGAVADQQVAEALPRGNGELILVVDDETSILDITKQTLLAFGYRVVTAEDGAQAISLYALQRDEIALVLTDMMMPVMDGTTLILALQRINPRVRVIAASGLKGNQDVARATSAGVKHFLPKPYSADMLLQLINQVLRNGGSRPPM